MNPSDVPRREPAPPPDRLSQLSEAILRINDTLDFDRVLQEVVDSATALTGATFGVITPLDASGRLEDYFTSGMTAEEREALVATPGSMQFFEYLSGLQEPLRVPDFHRHTRSLGLPEFTTVPVKAFLSAPIRHQREGVGNIYLARDEDGPEFGREDQESLVLFAAQAALVIANARRYRDEQRARVGLETLIETSPVGVAVFDARTGAPLSFNREAVRIMEVVRLPDRPPEDLLHVLTVRRFDGQVVSLGEFSLAQVLGRGETVRAEEIVLSVPDGRSVTALVNATPMRSDDGDVESVVVTFQDMSSVQELENLRAEFLGMVSHELQAPLTSIKGAAATLLESLNALDPAMTIQFIRIIESQANRMRDLIIELLDVAHIETGSLSIDPAPADVTELLEDARNTFQSGGSQNRLSIDVTPDLPWVMADRQRIVQVLGNLLANAARHSDEDSPIRLKASPVDDCVAISVSDDGPGNCAGALAVPVPEIRPDLRRRRAAGDCGVWSRPCHLQGDRGGARRSNLGGERWRGPGNEVHLHTAGGRRDRGGGRLFQAHGHRAAWREKAGAHLGGGRRPTDAAVRPGRPIESWVHAGCDGRPGRGPPHYRARPA